MHDIFTPKNTETNDSHFFFVLGARFQTTGLFEQLTNYQWILLCTIILSSEYHNI